MGSPMTLSHVTVGALERSTSRSHRFQSLISHKAANLVCRKLPMSYQLQVSQTLRSMDLLFIYQLSKLERYTQSYGYSSMTSSITVVPVIKTFENSLYSNIAHQ